MSIKKYSKISALFVCLSSFPLPAGAQPPNPQGANCEAFVVTDWTAEQGKIVRKSKPVEVFRDFQKSYEPRKAAERALELLKGHSFDWHCKVLGTQKGESVIRFEFFTSGAGFPNSSINLQGEDCEEIDLDELRAAAVPDTLLGGYQMKLITLVPTPMPVPPGTPTPEPLKSTWDWVLNFGPDDSEKEQAENVKDFIKEKGLSRICYIGRVDKSIDPDVKKRSSLIYFKK
jgi:hypothetical protein